MANSSIYPGGHDNDNDSMDPKQRKALEKELQRQREEQQAKQKINDGINLKQGEIKKHQEIDWETNQKLNTITKTCIGFIKDHFNFEDYLIDREQKDPKFVNLAEEEAKLNEDDEEIDLHLKSPSQSDEEMDKDKNKKHMQNYDQAAAEESFLEMKNNVCTHLFKTHELLQDYYQLDGEENNHSSTFSF